MGGPPPLGRVKHKRLDGKYELLAPAGRGGMATVWRARMVGAAGFERTVAVKKMHTELRSDADYLSMFVEEARVGSQLTHSNVVQVYDFCGDAEQGYYLVMEWVEGVSLQRLVRHFTDAGSRPPWDLMVYVLEGIAQGLNAAHDRLDDEGHPCPIIHRDVTPSNILCSVGGQAKLTDFGVARADDRDANKKTAPGIVKGKLAYTSPEVLKGQRPTESTDVFAVGVCLWESLTGRRLFKANTDVETYRMIIDGNAQALDEIRDDLPPGLSDLCTKTLDPDPAKRPASALDLAEGLGEVLKHAKVRYWRDRLGEAVRQTKAENAAR